MHTPSTPHDHGFAAGHRARILGVVFLLAAIAFGTFVRARTALRDPNFDAVHPEGMLKSDPALLYYFVERILESGGGVPSDWRADPRIEHPLTTDVPATFPVGGEFVVAWAYQALGSDLPLHTFCVWITALFASLTAVGVYGLARELLASVKWAVLATALFSVVPANYRTIGFILVGEDFSLPWYFLHAWLAVRAARVRTPVSIALAAAALGVALSTWHAASFVLTVEVACLLAWFTFTGVNPFAAPRAWIAALVLCAFAFAVPVLRATSFALSLPMQWMFAMLLAAAWARRGGQRRARTERAAAWLAWALLACASLAVSRWTGLGAGEYSHVFGLVWHKLVHFGALPADPRELPFEVRLMWQGPFSTVDPAHGLALLGLASLGFAAAALAIARRLRGRATDDRLIVLSLVACASVPVGALIERTLFLAGALLPVALAAVAREKLGAKLGDRRGAACVAALVAVQALWFAAFVREHSIAWYRPRQRQAEIAELVHRIPELVPDGQAIAADFMNSTAILAHTRHPIVFQPKWESRRTRERAEDFLSTFFTRSPAELRELLLVKYQCRYVAFDRFTLGFLSRYAGGLPRDQGPLPPGTAAAAFLSQDAEALANVPGYRLLYRSPATIVQSDGTPADFFRVYELAP